MLLGMRSCEKPKTDPRQHLVGVVEKADRGCARLLAHSAAQAKAKAWLGLIFADTLTCCRAVRKVLS